MQKAVISPLKVVISKSIMSHLKAVISTLKAVISIFKTPLLGLLSEPKTEMKPKDGIHAVAVFRGHARAGSGQTLRRVHTSSVLETRNKTGDSLGDDTTSPASLKRIRFRNNSTSKIILSLLVTLFLYYRHI